MLIRHLVTAILATISLLFSYRASKALTRYILDEIFESETNFEPLNFVKHDFEPTLGFDLYEDILSAFDSVQSEPAETNPNAANLFGDSPSSSSAFALPSSSSDAPGESPSFSSASPPPPPASAKSTTGHSGSTLGIRIISFYIIITTTVLRSCWFKRRSLPPPPPPSPPPLLRPSSSPPPVFAPPNPSATPSPAPVAMERLALVAAPARQVAGARRNSRRAKKRG